ncbi:DUF4440 domain-containing protein [Robertkochia marina]|uniref:DUF4440 domain-containing protein n=1 Tax=Robertkochia marina TaxID=1227945 RepID=A0A4S3M2A7_9FLAO|nr:DUF4440 domain-containing protein [Robertkochia marina]THD69252.1 DUF4440 domain-containing protein [Robertkochia marina]TRZ47490.1 DUF4440 domain-containing protein [Robertkochia marina]
MKTRIIVLLVLVLSSTLHAQTLLGDQAEGEAILATMKDFSRALVAGDGAAIAKMYTNDARLFPVDRKILSGQELVQYWAPENVTGVTSHQFFPEEINVMGDTAYDFGYYSGTSTNDAGEVVTWKGKYVVVWKKTPAGWKMYLDSWNRVVDE